MPIVESSTYRPPFLLGNAHLQTLWPTLFRPASGLIFARERLPTPDEDELLLDWLRGPKPSGTLAILSHGLEGSSRRPYIAGMARALQAHGLDVLAWNLRGCGGELNRQSRFYHSGETGDLRTIIETATSGYDRLFLVGFSVGGNITLRYLGEAPGRVDARVARALAFSVPCDLGASARRLMHPSNAVYLTHFLRSLRGKIRAKAARFPGMFPVDELASMRNFVDFDERVTAPMFGFAGADEYYARASSAPVLAAIRVPTLLVNALDDPFLTPECFPRDLARASDVFHLETPARGGHVGFVGDHAPLARGWYWSERRGIEWLLDAEMKKAPRGAKTGAAL